MKIIYRHPVIVITVVALITVLAGFGLTNLRIEGGTVFLPDSHPASIGVKETDRIFGSSDIITVMLELETGTVFSPETLRLIDDMTEELAGIPEVEEVTSLTNMDFMREENGDIVVESLVPDVPDTDAAADIIRERAQSWDFYRGFLYSEDFRAAQIIITLSSPKNESPDEAGYYTGVVEQIRDITEKYRSRERRFYIAGESAVQAVLIEGITRDMVYLLPILILILMVILYAAFRSVNGIVLPLLTVLISTVWAMSLMSAFGVPLNILGTTIPLLLVTVGSAYGIHFLNHFFEEQALDTDGTAEKAHAVSALERTVDHVGIPILLAGITTMAGFGSLAAGSVPAIRNMGIFTASGILSAVLLNFTLVPAVLVLRSSASRKHADRGTGAFVTKALAGLYNSFIRKKSLVLVTTVLLAGLSVLGIIQITVGQPTINFFSRKSEIREAARFAGEKFGGTTVMNVVISSPDAPDWGPGPGESAEDSDEPVAAEDAGESEGTGFDSFGDLEALAEDSSGAAGERTVASPELLSAVAGLEEHLVQKFEEISTVVSLADMISRMNEIMQGSPEYYEIPADPEKYGLTDGAGLQRLIAQYLLLYSGNLSNLVDRMDNPLRLKGTIQLNDGSPDILGVVRQDIMEYSGTFIEPLGYNVRITGLAEEMLAMNGLITRSQLLSIGFALGFVLVVLWITYRSFTAGVFTIIPIALSLLLNFAVMGFLRIPLDIVTALIASIAIGIGIDYSIHVVSAYTREYRKTNSHSGAARNTLALTGRAVLYNVVSVALGFAILVFSVFTPLNTAGILIGVIMVTSSFFALTLLPVLFAVFNPKFLNATGRQKQ